jgi:predicted extracellular nuclease
MACPPSLRRRSPPWWAPPGLPLPLALLGPALLLSTLASCGGEPLVDAQGVTPIHRVQGAADRSPLEGAEVKVEGVVTAIFPDLEGFFLQTPEGEEDDNPATSQGLFVAGPALAALEEEGVGPGARIRVRGVVVERGGAADREAGRPTLTALEGATLDSVVEASGELPQAVPVSAAPLGAASWEALEGMLVRVEAPLTVSGQSGLQRFGELITSFEGRLFQPTEIYPPGLEAQAKAARVAARTLVLDDGSTESWPRSVGYLPGPGPDGWPDHDAPLRAGSVLGPVTGVVDVRRGGYLLLPVERIQVVESAPRPAPPALPDDPEDTHLRVAVMNVENLFNGDGEGGGFPTPRGAQTLELYQVQQAKLVATLAALDADVVALAEVENDGAGPRTAIRQFVEALNAAGPHRDWTEVEMAQGPGTDAIRVGILYRRGRVALVGSPVVPEDPIFAWGSRPPLGQAFRRMDGSGEAFGQSWLVVSNHLKSKGGCPEAGNPRASSGDFDLGDGQACWNAHRVAAARAMADWLERDPSGLGEGSAPALVVGDLNSYAREDPIALLQDRGWRNAFEVAGLLRPYSYVFQGQAGRLDHFLVHESRRGQVVDAWIWHTNADEFTGFGYEYDPEPTVWRSSDHDPLVVVLETRGPSDG